MGESTLGQNSTEREVGSAEARGVVVNPGMSAAEIEAALRNSESPAVPLVDPNTGEIIGILLKPGVNVSLAVDRINNMDAMEPPRLGGMATPLGVYLTDGVVSGGAGFWGLLLTGMSLCGIALIAQAATQATLHILTQRLAPTMLLSPPVVANALPYFLAGVVQMSGFLPLLLVFVLLRLAPLSGTHAAEHQVVHCVERREPLVPNTVRQMPRVHPRCGTNLFAGLNLFLIVFVVVFMELQARGSDVVDAASIGAVVAAPITLRFWRDLGSFLQYWLATRPATDRQIAGAIKAAEQVIKRRAEARALVRPIKFHLPLRIWRMGLIQVLIGYTTMFQALALIARHFPAFSRILEINFL